MKSLKWVSIVTFVCVIFSLIMLIIFFFLGDEWYLGYDISLAIFGSAILGFIISIIQYYAEKRKSMEAFYLESLNLLNTIYKIKYFEFVYEKNKILECIAEEYKKEFSGSTEEIKAKKEIIIEISKNYEESALKKDEVLELCEKKYDEIIEKTTSDMVDIMNEYIEISRCSLRHLDDTYGGLDFIFGNEKIRCMAYDNIYSEIRDAFKFVKEKSVHFEKYFKASHGNKPVMLGFLLELNNYFFSENIQSNENSRYILIFNQKYDAISDKLEWFRCKIYRKKYESVKPTIIKSFLKNMLE